MEATKRERRMNFSSVEIAVITEFINENRETLFGKLSPQVTKQKKNSLWKELSAKVTAIGVAPRTVEDIKTKFKNLKVNAKQSYQEVKKARSMTGGGPSSELSPAEEKICQIFEHTPSFEGLAGFQAGASEEDNKTENSAEKTNTSKTSALKVSSSAKKRKTDVDDVFDAEAAIQKRRLEILEIEYQVKTKELEIRNLELEKVKVELNTAKIMAANDIAYIEQSNEQ